MKYAIHSTIYEESEKFREEDYIKFKMEELMKYMNEHFKNRYVKLKRVENCYYTCTKTEDFLIDWTD